MGANFIPTPRRGTAFIAALTAVDQLSATDRKRISSECRRELVGRRYDAQDEAEYRFHVAAAAAMLASRARRGGCRTPQDVEAQVAADTAFDALVDAVDAYMALPARTKFELGRRKRHLTDWGWASMAHREQWLKHRARWDAMIDAEGR